MFSKFVERNIIPLSRLNPSLMFPRSHAYFRHQPHFGSQSYKSTSIHVGRMTPETTKCIIEKEFYAELKTDGWRRFNKKIETETEILENISAQKKEIMRKIHNECVNPAILRAKQGYSTNGFFWKNSQHKMNQIITKEQLQEAEEKIDWLAARKKLFKELLNFPQSEDSGIYPVF